jgi:hypothetical protein
MSDDYQYRRPGASWSGLREILRQLEARPVVDPSEVAAANMDMLRSGARTRYRPDGSAFLLSDGEEDPAAEANRAA